MRLLLETRYDYEEIGGTDVVHAALKDALDALPREHLRQLDGVVALDTDPKGKALGIYARDHEGNRVEIYVHPHVLDALRGPRDATIWTLRLHVAHTLFHEIGHHVTLTLNRRKEPSRKRADVAATLEKWAEEYTEKRQLKFCETRWKSLAESPETERRAFLRAAQFLRIPFTPPEPESSPTTPAEEPSKEAAPVLET